MTTRHNDASRIADALANLEASSTEYDGSKPLVARNVIRRSVTFPTSAVNANGSNVVLANAGSLFRAPANGKVLSAYFFPQAGLTEHASNNAQITVKTLFANGWANAVIATANTAPVVNGGTGTMVAGGQYAVPANSTTTSSYRFSKGEMIGVTITENASGVAVPAGTIQLDYELEGAMTDYPV